MTHDILKEAKQASDKELIRSIRESESFTPCEADDKLNDSTHNLINAMVNHHGTIYLGNISLHGAERGKMPVLRKYPDNDIVYNFQHSFAVPTDDEELKQLIHKRDTTPYTGTIQDGKLVDEIFNRIEKLGGTYLTWS